jgi:hypothetical protein
MSVRILCLTECRPLCLKYWIYVLGYSTFTTETPLSYHPRVWPADHL